jgi:hypothetical protein
MTTIHYDVPERFWDEAEFIDCFNRGCEMQFDYEGKSYSCCAARGAFPVWEVGNDATHVTYDTAEAVLDYPIGDKRLRDILQDMTVTERTIY